VIPRIADKMRGSGLTLDDYLSDEERIVAYSQKTVEAVAACPALPYAEDLLRRARELGSVYISSNTPEVLIKELVSRRGWLPLVNGVYGYPRSKRDTLHQIVAECGGQGDRVLVVGDGISDEEAARDNGCVFVKVDVHSGLAPASAALEMSGVQK
jgi:phosphoglycolate phosphatase-like HAD superfamily hydrolase